MIPLAHSAKNGRPPQSYHDHVTGVVDCARRNVNMILPFVNSGKAAGYIRILTEAATYHDLGKLATRNQDVLTGKTKAEHLPIDHRDAGVKYLLGSAFEYPSATLIYAHHCHGRKDGQKVALPNISEEMNSGAPFRSFEAMTDSDAHLLEYLEIHNQELGALNREELFSAVPKLSSMEYRILLSCLVDADYSDASGDGMRRSETRWEERLQKLDSYVYGLQRKANHPLSERDQLRGELYDCCRIAGTENSLEYCDSPVGTGKTTAVMAHMLRSAAQNGLRHVFVVLPYTNIISQTVEILRDALVLDGENPAEIVAEHHHQADFETSELRHLASAWTAPIIVTTAVQFFETIAASRSSKLRKLHQLPGSGIVIDESHASLPIMLMPSAWRWITELAGKWGCRFCLCSGTSFRFWESPDFTKISEATVYTLLTETLSRKLEQFECRRIRLNIHKHEMPHFQNVSELINFMSCYHGSRLVVLNTVQSAAFLAMILRNSGQDVLHLSTALTPDDRELVMKEVKRRLDPAINYCSDWTLIATSCVECGMNFSFHYGFCEMRSLQSYLQLGGRVSRNNEFSDGTLNCFTMTADGFSVNPSFNISINVFHKLIESGNLPALTITDAVSRSFNMECKEFGGLSDKIGKSERQKAFADVSRDFRVISDDTVTVIADPKLFKKLCTGAFVSPRELQRGSVNIRLCILKRLHLAEGELPVLSSEQYDGFIGYMKSLI